MIFTRLSCTHWRKFILRGWLSCTQWRKTCFGCPTVVPVLMKYRLGGTTYVPVISDFFIQYMMWSCSHWRIGLLRTLCKWVEPKRRLLYEPARRGQSHWNTWQQSFTQGVTEQMHKRSWHSFYAPKACITLYTRSSAHPFAISYVRNSFCSFHRN